MAGQKRRNIVPGDRFPQNGQGIFAQGDLGVGADAPVTEQLHQQRPQLVGILHTGKNDALHRTEIKLLAGLPFGIRKNGVQIPPLCGDALIFLSPDDLKDGSQPIVAARHPH